MKKHLFILITATVFMSCSKDKDDSNGIVPITGVAKYKTVTYNDVTTYTYDQYGRQAKEANSDGSFIESLYEKGKVIRKVYNNSGALTRTVTITLNADGLRDTETLSDKPGNYTKYAYTTGKKLGKFTSKAGADIYEGTYYYTGENLDSIRYTNNGVHYLTNIYTFYLDKPNVQIPENIGISYYKANYANMMKTLTHVGVNGNISPETYSYEYDATGRMITLTEVSNNGTSVGYYTYY
jgi:hypothetical protein